MPFKEQHELLKNVQSLLEHAFFDFAQQQLPNHILRDRGWISPVQGELNEWTKIALKYPQFFDPDKLREIPQNLPDLVPHITEIRHCAVHRREMDGSKLWRLLRSAKSMAYLLGHKRCQDFVASILSQVDLSISEEQRRYDNQLEDYRKTCADAAARREELEDAIDKLRRELRKLNHDEEDAERRMDWAVDDYDEAVNNALANVLPVWYRQHLAAPTNVAGTKDNPIDLDGIDSPIELEMEQVDEANKVKNESA